MYQISCISVYWGLVGKSMVKYNKNFSSII